MYKNYMNSIKFIGSILIFIFAMVSLSGCDSIQSNESIDDEVSSCYTDSSSQSEVANCFKDVAIKYDNVTLCEKINLYGIGYDIKTCVFEVASVNNNVSDCEIIKVDDWMAMFGHPDNLDVQNRYYSECVEYVSLNNIEDFFPSCKNLQENTYLQNYCFYKTAILYSDESICDNIIYLNDLSNKQRWQIHGYRKVMFNSAEIDSKYCKALVNMNISITNEDVESCLELFQNITKRDELDLIQQCIYQVSYKTLNEINCDTMISIANITGVIKENDKIVFSDGGYFPIDRLEDSFNTCINKLWS